MRYLLLFIVGMICFSGKIATAKTLNVVATFYCNCYKCCGKQPSHPAYGITASGKKASDGTVAVDPKIIPLGSKLKIKGMEKTFVALDTGGAIKGNRIDIWCASHKAALLQGRKKLTVTILPEKSPSAKSAKSS